MAVSVEPTYTYTVVNARGHAERLGDVEGLFRVIAALRIEAFQGRSIRGNAFDRGEFSFV